MALDLKSLGKLKWYSKAMLVILICGALLAGVWYQFLNPMQLEIESKNGKVGELQTLVAKSEAHAKELAKIKKLTLELEAKLEMLKAILPLERETDQIFRAVQLEAGASGLKVSRVAPRTTINHEVYTE